MPRTQMALWALVVAGVVAGIASGGPAQTALGLGLVGAACAGMAGVSLRIGVGSHRTRWHPAARRDERPGWFWFDVGSNLVLAAVFLFVAWRAARAARAV